MRANQPNESYSCVRGGEAVKCGTPWDVRKSVAAILSLGHPGIMFTKPFLHHVIFTFDAGSLTTQKSTAFVAVHLVSNNQEPDPSLSWRQNLKVFTVTSNASFAGNTFAFPVAPSSTLY